MLIGSAPIESVAHCPLRLSFPFTFPATSTGSFRQRTSASPTVFTQFLLADQKRGTSSQWEPPPALITSVDWNNPDTGTRAWVAGSAIRPGTSVGGWQPSPLTESTRSAAMVGADT